MRRVRFFSLRLAELIAILFFATGCISTQGGRVSNSFDKTAAKSASLFMQSAVLAKGGRANAIIVTGKNPPIAEQTAVEELTHYLELITGADFEVVRESDMQVKNPCIFIGQTEYAAKQGIELSELGSEEWIVRTVGSNLIITGGRPRGTLYGTYHFLEDVLGVHWWNPWGDEYVPSGLTVNVGKLDMRGKPVFGYRDIFMLYGYDRGRFAARNRVNRDGDRLILPEYGGGPNYGFPDQAHTFSFYIPPEKYFKEHPDWFAFMEGRRTKEDNYLCLTNPELQQVFFDKLIEYIRLSFRNAERQGFERPMIFDISQSEYRGHCTCERCKAMAEKYGSEAGVLLDFINRIADKVKEKYPNLGFLIETLAYHETEKVPTGISPRNNVVIRLCDTSSNLIKPVTHPDNSVFRENILSWAPITKNLWIWDYAVTFDSPNGLPMPSMHTYPADYRFYAENGVSGIFTEHEYPDIGDMRDMKIWMMAKMMEDPYQDYDALVKTFTDGFYGPAGLYIRDYLAKLEKAAERKSCFVDWYAPPGNFKYLDLDFILEAQSVFDRAESVLNNCGANKERLISRLRHARLSLDRATVILFPKLEAEWTARGHKADTMPFDRELIGRRALDTWYAVIEEGRIPAEEREEAKKFAYAELSNYVTFPDHVLPGKKGRKNK